MAIETTYRKVDENVLIRQRDIRTDVDGNTVVLMDKEVEFNHKRRLPGMKTELDEIRTEITNLQSEESQLAATIAAIETTRDSIRG